MLSLLSVLVLLSPGGGGALGHVSEAFRVDGVSFTAIYGNSNPSCDHEEDKSTNSTKERGHQQRKGIYYSTEYYILPSIR